MLRPLFLLILSTCLTAGAAGDGELLDQIERVSQQLRVEPGRADLFLVRADLLRRWGRLEAALGDVRQAQRHGAEQADLTLAKARVQRDAGHPYRALAGLGRCIDLAPDHLALRQERAQLLNRLGRSQAAARDYAWVASHNPTPSPDLFVAWHRELVGAGLPAAALAALEAGRQALGPLVSLELPALELELELGRFDAALERTARLQRNVPRMDGWGLTRGRVLALAGRSADAGQAYRDALQHLAQLNPRRRRTVTARQMREQAEQALAELSR